MKKDRIADGASSRCPLRRIQFLRHENPADYEHSGNVWLDQYQPCGDSEVRLVQRVIDSEWRAMRSDRLLESYEHKLNSESPDPSTWTKEQWATLARLRRFQEQDERTFHRSCRATERLQAVRYTEERRIEFWAEVMLRDACLSDEDYDIKRDARHRWLKMPSMATGQDQHGCPCPVCIWLWRVNNYQPEKEPEE